MTSRAGMPVLLLPLVTTTGWSAGSPASPAGKGEPVERIPGLVDKPRIVGGGRTRKSAPPATTRARSSARA